MVVDGGASFVASAFIATLRISQIVYELKAVGEQTRNLLDTTKYIDESVRAVRQIRRQKSALLNQTEKGWIDGVLQNTELAVSAVARLIEPARVDMITRSNQTKDIKIWHRTLFVLRDSPKVTTNLTRLGVATQGLNSAMVILCNREGYKDNNLAVASTGGTIRRRASSPGGPRAAPPPYDYQDFLNRRKPTVVDKGRKLHSKASKASFMAGDDQDLYLASAEPQVKDEELRAPEKWIEPEDIIDPVGRGLRKVRPDPHMLRSTVEMVNSVLPEPIERPEQAPACVPDPPTPGPDEQWVEEALHNFRRRQEISNEMLRHEHSMYQLRAKMDQLTPSQPSRPQAHIPNQNPVDRSGSTGSHRALYDPMSVVERPSSSQSSYRASSDYVADSDFTSQEPLMPPPIPPKPSSWLTPNSGPSVRVPYPPDHNSSSEPSEFRADGRGSPSVLTGLGIKAPNQLAPIPMPDPISHKSSQDFTQPDTSPQSLSPYSSTSPLVQYMPLTHANSAPAVPHAHNTAMDQFSSNETPLASSQCRSQTHNASYPPELQGAYSHLHKGYSMPTPLPEHSPDSHLLSRFLPRFGSSHVREGSQPETIEPDHANSRGAEPIKAGRHKHTTSFTSTTSAHSYEPWDPTLSRALPATPRDSVVSLGSMSSLSAVSTDTRFELESATSPIERTRGHLSRQSSGVSSMSSGRSAVSRGRSALEFRMRMEEKGGLGDKGQR